MILAGIVTYNPSIDRLEKNIQSVLAQVDAVLVTDNASTNQKEIESLAQRYKLNFLPSKKNDGLGSALNKIFQFANEKEFDWVITLDQDSILPDEYIILGRRYFDNKEVGIITCGYVENNLGTQVHPITTEEKYLFSNRSITSAAIVRLEAYNKTDGYDVDMFIDYVDFDFSIKIRKAGYKILSMTDVKLNHELGDSRWVRFLFWKIRYTAHNAKREYYIARNITIFIWRYKGLEDIRRDRLSLIKHYVFVILYDRKKKEKLKALHAGRKDGRQYIREHRKQ